MQDLSNFRYFAGGRDRGGWTFSGGAFGWGFRVGLSGGTRGLRQNSHIVFTTHKGHFSVRFLSRGLPQQAQVVFAAGKREFSVVFRARGRCQLDYVVFAAGKRGFSVVFRARGRCQLDHVVYARASLYGHCFAGEMLGNTRTTSGRGREVRGRGRGAKYGIWAESCTSRPEFVHFAGF